MASIGVHMVISSSQNRQRAGLIRTIQQNRFSVRRSRQRVAGSSNSNSNPEEDNKNTNAFSFSEDLNYLWTLGAGSVGGAVVIKYGSILFPAITRPNIIPALIMISMPMLIAVLLLIKQSRVDEHNKGPA